MTRSLDHELIFSHSYLPHSAAFPEQCVHFAFSKSGATLASTLVNEPASLVGSEKCKMGFHTYKNNSETCKKGDIDLDRNQS